jgi:hypothetical protein
LRQIHHLRIRRLDHVNGPASSLLHLYLLLWITAQCARSIRLRPQTLDGCRHQALICRDRGSNGRIVIDILRHHLDYLGETCQGDECRIKALLLRRFGELRHSEVVVLPQPVIEIQDLLRIGGRRRDLRQQGVRIQRNRRQQLIQLLGCGHRRHLCLQVGSKTLKQEENNQQKNGRQTRFALHQTLRIRNRQSTILL